MKTITKYLSIIVLCFLFTVTQAQEKQLRFCENKLQRVRN